MGAGAGAAIGGAMQGLGGFLGSKQNRKATESTNRMNMQMFQDQRAHQLDPTNPLMQGAVGAGANFAQGMFENPLQNPLAQLGLGAANGTNPLVQFANSQLGGTQPNPEMQTFANAQNALGGMMGGQMPGFNGMFSVGAPAFGPLQFGRQQIQQAPGANAQQVQAPQIGGFSELQFNNPFIQQAANPFSGMGQRNSGLDVIAAQTPIFQQQLREAQAGLANATPGRFSSAFADQSMDLSARALRDFNMFGAQALQQGQQQQLQEQQTALNFLLGSRGQAADAFGQQAQAQLGARGLQQDLQGQQAQLGLQAGMANQNAALQAAGLNQEGINAFNQSSLQAQQLFQQGQLDARGLEQQLFSQLQQLGLDANTSQQQAQLQAAQIAQSGQLGAASTMGQLAGQAGQNPFNRLLQQGQFGMQQQGQMQQALAQLVMGPMAQLLMGGMNFAAPSDMQTIVGPSGLMGGPSAMQHLGLPNGVSAMDVMRNPSILRGMF